jgi:2-amino-4,5-dihydroxy-6-oxo-7-(phosphonooxy)heptanoate synthase
MASINSSFARSVRLRRLYRYGDRRLLVVPMDHSVTDGSISGGARLDRLVGQLAGAGVDAVVLHKGALRHLDGGRFAELSLIVHLSASTVHAPDPDAKYLVSSVEESLRLGADAVSVHVNLGSDQEAAQLRDLAAVSDACDRWNVPLLAMMYPRGPKISDPRDPAVVAHAVAIAVDLGVDIVKTVPAGTTAELREITRDCPLPVILAGGPRRDSTRELASFVEDGLRAGAAGVAMGRNIFQQADPGAAARLVAGIVHRRVEAPLRAERFEPNLTGAAPVSLQ